MAGRWRPMGRTKRSGHPRPCGRRWVRGPRRLVESSISPAGLMIYDGTAFPQWRGDAFLGALSGQALIRVDLDGTSAAKVTSGRWGARIPRGRAGS